MSRIYFFIDNMNLLDPNDNQKKDRQIIEVHFERSNIILNPMIKIGD